MSGSSLTLPHDFDRVRRALRREVEVLDLYVQALTPFQWQGETACAGWNVQKVVSHVGSGADLHLKTLKTALEGAPAVTQPERQAVWDFFDSLPPDQLLPAFQDRARAYVDYLDGLSAEEGQTRLVQSFLGETPVVNFAQSRLSETALHSWDVRVALDATARLLADTVRAQFPYVLDGLTRRSKAEVRGELAGTRIALEVFGPVAQRFTLAIDADGVRASEGVGEADATLRLPAEAFVRLHSGRLPLERAESAGDVVMDGNRAKALRLNALFAGF